MAKVIHIIVEDAEHKALVTLKGALSWRSFLILPILHPTEHNQKGVEK